MSIKQITPSLVFDGKAAKAIELYQRALGAKVETILRFGDAAGMGQPTPESHKDRVMFAVLRVGDETFSVMDAPPGVIVPATSNVQILIDLDDPADMASRFDALSAGGEVTRAPHDAFWGARFGMLVDAFGIRWMLSCRSR
jgi:PhnB protein